MQNSAFFTQRKRAKMQESKYTVFDKDIFFKDYRYDLNVNNNKIIIPVSLS